MMAKITVHKYFKPSLGKEVNHAGYTRKVKDAPEREMYKKSDSQKKYMVFFNHEKYGEVIFGSYESIKDAEKNAKEGGLSQYKIYTRDELGHFKLLKRSNILTHKYLEQPKEYDFEKELTKDDLRMTKLRKKLKNHKFTSDEIIGFD